jgi:hypothetical protein
MLKLFKIILIIFIMYTKNCDLGVSHSPDDIEKKLVIEASF